MNRQPSCLAHSNESYYIFCAFLLDNVLQIALFSFHKFSLAEYTPRLSFASWLSVVDYIIYRLALYTASA